VLAFRQVQRIVYSESGVKRAALGRFETLFRRHSFLRALSHQNRKVTQSIFDNHEHFPWYFKENNETVTASFWEIYEGSLQRALVDVRAFAASIDCSAGVQAANEIAHAVTQGKNFTACWLKLLWLMARHGPRRRLFQTQVRIIYMFVTICDDKWLLPNRARCAGGAREPARPQGK
jgi:hypothetical protein